VLVVGNYLTVIHDIPVNRMVIWLERNIGKHVGEGSIMA
jgi:predicted nucleotide-binding protein (sugar kinase/HSP70/actin superfamily)